MTTPQTRHNYRGMTQEQILDSMSDAELERNVRRGGQAAIAYKARKAVRALGIIPDMELDIGV